MTGILKNRDNIIIVGGGTAGLMAARELLKKGRTVTILEASDRLGGRIHTIHHSSFIHPVEKGVEFIHGNLPLTIQLLKEAGIKYESVKGKMVRIVNGEWEPQDDFTIDWDELIKKMNEIRGDVTVNDFLNKNFSDKKYEALRRSVIRFAEGFDLADPSRASVLALRGEWMEEGRQYRIPGGYDQLINYLEEQCLQSGCIIYRSSCAAEIKWKKNEVNILTKDKKVYNSNKVIITVSLGFLQNETRSVIFKPAIDNYPAVAQKIGFGSVIKILLQFKEAFWEEKKKNIGFILTNEVIPTWWTQRPSSYPLLTGWAGGPQAWPLENKKDKEILESALQSLSNIFKKSMSELKRLLTASLVANWKKDPYSKGAYSYSTLESDEAQNFFETPVQDTIFFAGEAFYKGSSPGTVEAALVSAKNAAERVVNDEL